jgi:hypothetical protein
MSLAGSSCTGGALVLKSVGVASLRSLDLGSKVGSRGGGGGSDRGDGGEWRDFASVLNGTVDRNKLTGVCALLFRTPLAKTLCAGFRLTKFKRTPPTQHHSLGNHFCIVPNVSISRDRRRPASLEIGPPSLEVGPPSLETGPPSGESDSHGPPKS